ncbi:ankyrin repeat protein [Seminavis robusta]|uniref:Ankyrin repeat protein n=1 Tax=Seminavis robusta TaxID=568900 RepID=A0A9N8DT79_9STRA|nr:ankyrin repeat protein [Seminavis robusta]|eukprot:Sro353_g124630.1 ankyrin repeat protein (337) ;mRNA; f:60479-61489
MNTATATNDEGNSTTESRLLFADDLIWIGQILPFVGVGHYAFVGAVNKKMNMVYKEYCKIELEKNPRKVKDNPEIASRSAEITDTLYSQTFCNKLRAEYWLKDNSSNRTPDRDHVCNAIANVGNPTVMLWARQKRFPWSELTCALAAKNGHFEMRFQWLRENGCPWDGQTCASAARNGHLKLLRWAREKGCPWDARTCTFAAGFGHMAVLKWAHANGCSWSVLTCALAAEYGLLGMLQWLRENGCPWDERTCASAARYGHMKLLRWARDNGCPWNEWTCTCAARNGHLEILKWARENGCPWDEVLTFPAAIGSNNSEVIQWLRDNDCPGSRDEGDY